MYSVIDTISKIVVETSVISTMWQLPGAGEWVEVDKGIEGINGDGENTVRFKKVKKKISPLFGAKEGEMGFNVTWWNLAQIFSEL